MTFDHFQEHINMEEENVSIIQKKTCLPNLSYSRGTTVIVILKCYWHHAM